MIRLDLTAQDREMLIYERYHHPHPFVQRRMEALHLKSLGFKHEDIRRICGVCKSTLVTYLRLYQKGGVEALKCLNYKGHPSELAAHATTLEAYFREHPPHTVTEARSEIARLTGIMRSRTQVWKYLRRLGMRFRKSAAVPGKAPDVDKLREQDAFEQDKLRPALAEAEAGKRLVFFP